MIKGGSHRRMQSLQPASVRDMSLLIEGSGSPSLSPTKPSEKFNRPATPVRSNTDNRFSDRDSTSSTPVPGPSLTPIVRPIVRRPPPQSILGENTPPQSSTMLALQNMGTQSPTKDVAKETKKETEDPISNITNGSTALVKHTQNLDQLSNQILSLTNIATSLQKEMSQLSRRSRDNATDLLSLKEATNTRDEDIRRSLRELLTNTNDATSRVSSRDPFGGLYLDNKPHNISPANTKSFQLPRIPSPKSFTDSIDRASVSTPSLTGSEAPASIALLEKIIREMGTKEGQESLLTRLIDVSNKLSGMATSAKVDDLVNELKAHSESAIITDDTSRSRNYTLDDEPNRFEMALSQAKTGPVTPRVEQLMKNEGRRNSEPFNRGAELLNDDLINIIRSVKDSVAQGGGLTAEVKALVRELRGEVLGMGRELGRRLEQQSSRRSVEEHETPSKDEVARVIDEGLEQMKDQLNHVLREHRRASAASANAQKSTVDYQEIYNAMRAALKDNEASQGDEPDLSREDVIEAVRDAWENYKPEIEVQQLGLEREEVLACLKQGLQEYAPKDNHPPAATRDEVFTAVVEGLKHYVPPQVDTPAAISREEIVDAVRDCLEEFEFPIAPSAIGNNELTREDMVHAVKEGLNDLDLAGSRALVPQSFDNDEVVNRLKDIMEYMQHEFKAVSEESKENVAANGRDTEQVLDATKDGLENLRQAIESYVDRATGVTGQEEFLDDLLKSLDDFKDEIAGLVLESNKVSQEQLQTELEGLREVVNSSMIPAPPPPAPLQNNNTEIMEALNTGFNNIRQEILRPRAETRDILDALNDGLNDLRAGMDRITNKPVDLTANDEILDALRVGLDSLRTDIEAMRDSDDKAVVSMEDTPKDDALEGLKASLDAVRSDIGALRDSHEKTISNVDPAPNGDLLDMLKTGLDSLRVEIESLRDSNEKAITPVDLAPNEEILDTLRTGLDSLHLNLAGVRDSVAEKAAAPVDEAANKEILDAVKTGLETLRGEIEALRDSNEKAITPLDLAPNEEILDTLRTGLDSLHLNLAAMQETVSEKATPADETANKEVLDAVKTGLEAVRSEIATLKETNNERALVAKDSAPEEVDVLKPDDIKNLELLISDLTLKVEAMENATKSAPKDDMAPMEEMIRNIRDTIDEMSTRDLPETTARAVPKEKKEDEEVNGDDAASKDDVQAIETILRNTKAQLDEIIEGEQAVRKDHIDAVETLILETRESVNTITTNLETANTQLDSITATMDEIPRKEQITTLESLVTQITASLDEVKERAIKDSENPENVSKSDVEAVEDVVIEIKTVLDAFAATADFTTLANKENVASLETVVKEFAEKLDLIVDSHTKAIEVRNTEMTGVGERVTEVKAFLEEFQGTIKSKLEEGSTGVESLSKLLECLGEKIDKNENVGQDLKEMFDTMKTEFEDSKDLMAGVKLESNEQLQEATESLGVKIDEKINELIAKYDDVQLMLDDKAKASETRDAEMEAAVVGSKAIADELKLLIDTLGTTVTDSLEKMEEASMTVFSRVEGLVTKNDENHTEDKAEHQQTRDQVTQALAAVEGLKGEVTDFQPKVLEAVKDLLLIVGEHFEHSKSSVTEIQEKIIENKAPEHLSTLLPPDKYDNTEVHEKLNTILDQKYDDSEVRERLEKLAELKYDDTEIREKLNQIIEHKYDDTELREKIESLSELKYDDATLREKLDTLAEQKYDDAVIREKLDTLVEQKYDDILVHEKLDKLVDHTSSADQAFSRLDTLDKVHASVVKTAADISEFLSSQTQRITDEHEDREKTLQETTVAVERKLAEQDHLEASILSLRDEEERLRQSVISLRMEQESLIRQKTRLTGDVSSLETAMRLRKEELYDMESRAEHLERRIIDGVMDHSRVLLMSKASKSGDAMSRKRVKKPTDENESAPNNRRSVVNMALTAKRNLAPPTQGGSARRIVSLSQINNNVASGGVKRSQSVRTPAGKNKAYRKRSWGGDLGKGFEVDDKENLGMKETVEEVDEPETQLTIHPDSERAREVHLPGDETTVVNSALDDDGVESDNETLRRSSRGTNIITNSTDMSSESDGEGSDYSDDRSDYTESALGPASSVGTDGGIDGNEMVVYGH